MGIDRGGETGSDRLAASPEAESSGAAALGMSAGTALPMRPLRWLFRPDNARLLVLIALGVIFTFASPFFLTTNNLINVLMNAAVVGIVAAPATLLLVARQVDISIGSAVGFAATTLTVVAESRFGLGVAVLAAIGAAMGIAAINAVAITKLRVNSLIATLGTLAAFRGAAKLIGDGRSIRLDGFGFLGRSRFAIPGTDVRLPVAVLILLAVALLFSLLMRYTRYGLHMYAMGANPKAARLAGVSLERNVVIAFMLSGLSVALGSFILVSSIGATAPTTGMGLELLAITGVILGGASLSGGRGTIGGTLVAILILAVLDNGLTLMRVTSFWQEVVRGGLLVTAVAFDQLRLRRGKPEVRFEL
ncbi:MAG: ABC transporter permease [bacterium]|nr:ABC transporter permease [bacterium]MYC44910.1 ABC transporter permease [Acidimicrobiia bacterium]MYI56934.1 ABC transporter permease [Acidimicrobiia bacterium]